MADTPNMNTNAVLSIRATTSEKIKDLVIKDGQLIFMYDVGRLAFDYKGKRTLYNQIIEIETEQERIDLSDPVNGKYYFVIEKAILWRYFNGWIQITHNVDEVVFIGDEFPELGQAKQIYINTTEGNEHISVWDEETENYKIVADKTYSISAEEISAFF